MRSAPQPSLRSDAVRNRDAILVAARAVFAEQGLDAPLDAVARRAGVGRATLYRRFPTREDLVQASFDDNIEKIATFVADHPDPDIAFFDVLEATAELQRRDLGFIQALTRSGKHATVRVITERFLAVVAEPLAQAQRAGSVRADIEPADVMLLVEMLGGAAQSGHHLQALELLRDALTPAAAAAGVDTAGCRGTSSQRTAAIDQGAAR